jgi:hypothetical protein
MFSWWNRLFNRIEADEEWEGASFAKLTIFSG